MKALAALLLVVALAAPAAAGEYAPPERPSPGPGTVVSKFSIPDGDHLMANRPEVTFPGPRKDGPPVVHMSPYPQGSRAASVWNNDACWRTCQATCKWKTEYCFKADGADIDICRPYLDGCDRACQRSCRSWKDGPILGFIDF